MGEREHELAKRQKVTPLGCACTNWGRFEITIYDTGFNQVGALTHELAHVSIQLIRHTMPESYRAVEEGYAEGINNGADSILNIDEAWTWAFSGEQTAKKLKLKLFPEDLSDKPAKGFKWPEPE